MKLLQINTIGRGISPVATIMKNIHHAAKNRGATSYTACGYGHTGDADFIMHSRISRYFNALSARLHGNDGVSYNQATCRLISFIEKIQPDIVHLHNGHGYYLNVCLLHEFLQSRHIPFVVTMHDSWWLTGRCALPATENCQRYKSGNCHKCPHRNIYPAAWLPSKAIYKPTSGTIFVSPTAISDCNMHVHVIPNGTDFKPSKERVYTRPFALAVANIWTPGKSLDTLKKLAPLLDIPVWVVGDLRGQCLGKNIQHLGKGLSHNVLTQLYSDAKVLINPSLSESYGMTVAEAIACGTPAVIRAGVASESIISDNTGIAVDFYDTAAAIAAINAARQLMPTGKTIPTIKDMTDAYFALYHSILAKKGKL